MYIKIFTDIKDRKVNASYLIPIPGFKSFMMCDLRSTKLTRIR